MAASSARPLIPIQYQGVWDAYPAACEYVVSDMRLSVEPSGFGIYRDLFRTDEVVRNADGSLRLKVAYRSHDDVDSEGFGEPYYLDWRLSESADELTMTSQKGSTTWHRCPSKQKSN